MGAIRKEHQLRLWMRDEGYGGPAESLHHAIGHLFGDAEDKGRRVS